MPVKINGAIIPKINCNVKINTLKLMLTLLKIMLVLKEETLSKIHNLINNQKEEM